jgi:uncharacterized membrane protein YhaH (DUF805 family)
MGFGQAVKTCFRKYADFHGRASRSEYWYWTLFISLLVLAGFLVMRMLGLALLVGITALLAGLALFLPSLAVAVRRLHDTNTSGWWYLLALIPYMGGCILIIWYCFKGTQGENRFGPDPLNPDTAEAFD